MTLDEELYNGLLRMTKAWSIKSLCQTVIMYLVHRVIFFHHNIGRKLRKTISQTREAHGVPPMMMRLSYGGIKGSTNDHVQ